MASAKMILEEWTDGSFGFHCFPKDPERLQKWVNACDRPKLTASTVTAHSRICSLHFDGGMGPTASDPYPLPLKSRSPARSVSEVVNPQVVTPQRMDASAALLLLSQTGPHDTSDDDDSDDHGVSVLQESAISDVETSLGVSVLQESTITDVDPLEVVPIGRAVSTPKKVKWDVYPQTALNTVPSTVSALHLPIQVCAEQHDPQLIVEAVVHGLSKTVEPDINLLPQNQAVRNFVRKKLVPCDVDEIQVLPPEPVAVTAVSTPTKVRWEITHGRPPTRSLPGRQVRKPEMKQKESPSAIMSFEKSSGWPHKTFRRLTGITQANFSVLYEFLGGDVYKLKYTPNQGTPTFSRGKLTPKERLFLTLVRLRRGWTVEDMGLLFGTTTTVVSRTFYVWIEFLHRKFRTIKEDMFVSAAIQASNNMPACFKPFPKFRVIIDCTELEIQVPSNYRQQGNTYSQYKSRNTMKYLIGASCWGGVSFVSPGFEGSMSDRQCYRKSGIRKFLQPGDLILADRGFDIGEEANEDRVKLVIPPFLGKRKCLTPEEEVLTKKITAARTHVERTIRKIKCFKLLKNVSNTLLPILDQMVFVSGCLVNFDRNIVS